MRRSVVSCLAAAPVLAVLQSKNRGPAGTPQHRAAVCCQPVQQRGWGVNRSLFIQSHQRSLTTDYELQNAIGSGGFGTVVVGQHKRTGIRRAIKVIPKARTEKEVFLLEVEALMDLDHPHIVKIIDFFEDADSFYLVQELCTGPSVFDYVLNREGPLPDRDASIILRQCLKGILGCHVHGFIHRDVKLENFMITSHDGNVKLIDFGLSTRFISQSQKVSLKRSYSMVGTPDYIAPEMYAGRRDGYDKAVDLWSLGVVFFSILSKEFLIDYDESEIVIGQTYEMQHDGVGILVKAVAVNADGTYRVKRVTGMSKGIIDNVKKSELTVDIVSIATSLLADKTYVKNRIRGCKALQDRSPAALDLLSKLLNQDPQERISVPEALVHPFVLQSGLEPLMGCFGELKQHKDDAELHKLLPQKFRCFAEYSPLRQMALLAMSHLASEQQAGGEALHSLRMSFRSIDSNGDGQITFEELRQTLEHHGIEAPSDLAALFSACDIDNSGKLNYVEFLAVTFPTALIDKRICTEVFRLFDKNLSGTLDVDDFRIMFRSSKLGDTEAARILSAAESTLRQLGACKGVLTEEDFQVFMLGSCCPKNSLRQRLFGL